MCADVYISASPYQMYEKNNMVVS